MSVEPLFEKVVVKQPVLLSLRSKCPRELQKLLTFHVYFNKTKTTESPMGQKSQKC